MSLFSDFLSTLSEGAGKERIQAALDSCADISDEESLRDFVAGSTNAEITSLLKEELSLSVFDASALAGLLVVPTGNNISISCLIILTH
jgi:hypothetical protein